jgi:hypothetical protein
MRNLVLFSFAVTIILLPSIPAAFAQQQVDLEKYEVRYGGQVFEVRASLPGEGTIETIQVFPDYGSIFLVLDVDPEAGDGQLRIILPRSLIDSKTAEADSDFLVVVDSEETEYSELPSTETQRELLIPLPQDAFEIEIFGTQVLPEFTSQFVMLVAASIGIILITGFHRSRLLSGRLR